MAPKRSQFFQNLKAGKLAKASPGQQAAPGSAFHRENTANKSRQVKWRDSDDTATEQQTTNRAIIAAHAREDYLSGRGRKVTKSKSKPKSKPKAQAQGLTLPSPVSTAPVRPVEKWRPVGGRAFPPSAPPNSILAVARLPVFRLTTFLEDFKSELGLLLDETLVIEETVTREKLLSDGEKVVDVFMRFLDRGAAGRVMALMGNSIVSGRMVAMGFASGD
ncbi:hypothetical protein MBLNU230_g6131t1 [Neophaeotheca triangularis]